MQITLSFKDDATQKVIAASLRKWADIFEAQEAAQENMADPFQDTSTASTASTDAFEEEATFEEDAETKEEYLGTQNGFDEESSFEEETTETFEEETLEEDETEIEEEPKPKAAKSKAATAKTTKTKSTKKKGPSLGDVMDACKLAAKKQGRDKVLNVLKKRFKANSVAELKETDYEAVLKALKA